MNYYTPEVMAYYFIDKNDSIEKQFKVIDMLYEIDFTFIHPKYKNDKKIFKLDIQEVIEYLIDSEEYLNEERMVKKDYEQLGLSYENSLSEEELVDYYLMTIRLDRILENRSYSRKKLRTLLDTYGYKRKSNKIINHIQKSLLFYHIRVYVNKKPVNLSEINLDQMITFVVEDFENVNLNGDKISSKVQIIYEILENEIINYDNKIKIKREKGCVEYILNNKILFEIFFKEEYLKIQLSLKEADLINTTNYMVKYYIENNKLYLYLHDRKDINDSMELIKYTVNCLNVNNVTDSNIIKRNSNENVQYCTKEYFGKDTYESDIYQEIESFLRN
ncbi:MAG: hypothetical protein E7Z85_07405 [Methanosphaera stadtmanae]|nr:hypothetical protein [Methanosphaera stadtmanae]